MNNNISATQKEPPVAPKSKSEVWAQALNKNGKTVNGMNKIAFAPRDPNEPKKSFGEQVGTISKHPADFLLSALKGEASGLAAGAIGGAIVAAPLAAMWARKPKSIGAMKQLLNSGKSYFKGIDASGPKYSQRLAHHLFELGKGETVGGGVIGLGLGMGNFFKKYNNESSSNHV